jgi:hypothetical protein
VANAGKATPRSDGNCPEGIDNTGDGSEVICTVVFDLRADVEKEGNEWDFRKRGATASFLEEYDSMGVRWEGSAKNINLKALRGNAKNGA